MLSSKKVSKSTLANEGLPTTVRLLQISLLDKLMTLKLAVVKTVFFRWVFYCGL